MGGLFGVVSKTSCVMDLYFGTDYHSHLGTSRGGMAVWTGNSFVRSIHNIQNVQFRAKFEDDLSGMEGNMGIGCISDTEAQPLTVYSHLGHYAITTVGRINNIRDLARKSLAKQNAHFLEMSGGVVNPTEVVSSLIDEGESFKEGIKKVGEEKMRVGICKECGKELKKDNFKTIWDYQDEKFVKLCKDCYKQLDDDGYIED